MNTLGGPPHRRTSSVETARRLVKMLRGLGVTDVVLSPGSRSAALALALHAADAAELLRLHVRVDEREAGFLALGLAKASGTPVPVVTTSGTAVANLHPAVLEAWHARVPLIAVTADRPARLRGTGSNQTTIQPGIFGPLVPTIERVEALAVGDRPVHLNVEFDEPLVEPTEWEFHPLTPVPDAPEPQEPAVQLDGSLRTLVIAGDGAGTPARELAEAAGWPLLAEPSSGACQGPNLVPDYRLLLGDPGLVGDVEQVVSFGHSTLSRPVTAVLSRTDVRQVHVGDQGTLSVCAPADISFATSVEVEGSAPAGWLRRWQSAADALPDAAAEEPRYALARAVWQSVGAGDLLYLGPSNPIRDIDRVAGPSEAVVLSNRGLAGIDGVLSSAIGAALALRPARAVAFLGDLTFLHGSNGLLIGAHEPRPDLTIVVLNDDGGGIFSTLEQADPQYASAFERVFTTPTGADLGQLCAGMKVPHQVLEVSEISEALTAATDGVRVLEVRI